MSVFYYSGRPGAGKSYGAVEHLLIPAAKEGRAIVTNLALAPGFAEAFRAPVIPVPEDVAGQAAAFWATLPPGCLVVIDEAWRFFPAGIAANKLPEQVREALTMHRHRLDEEGRSQQWVLISQNPSQVSKFVRDLVEQHYRITKLSAVGAHTKFRVDVYEGVELDETKRIRQIFGSYSAEVWQWYRSHTLAVAGADQVDEQAIDKRGSIWRSGWVRFGFPAAALLLAFGVFQVFSFFGSFMGGGAEAAPAAGAAPSGVHQPKAAPSSPIVQKVAERPEKPLSVSWRLAALVQSETDGRLFVLLEGQNGRTRMAPKGVCEEVHRDWVCVVEGERVTSYSGGQSPSVGQAIVGGINK